jgi:hypothetical protein
MALFATQRKPPEISREKHEIVRRSRTSRRPRKKEGERKTNSWLFLFVNFRGMVYAMRPKLVRKYMEYGRTAYNEAVEKP